jgi:hypothetical protein
MFYIVGVTATCKRLAVCQSEQAAADYIATLPGYEGGYYYIDACTEPVTLAEVSPDDLPNYELES